MQTPRRTTLWVLLVALLAGGLALVGCGGAEEEEEPVVPVESSGEATVDGEVLSLPELEAAQLDGRPLEIVATSSIIGDVVATVGGDAINLRTLMEPDEDPHGYQPSSGDLAAVADADAIFVNGWDLEEGVLSSLEDVAEYGPLVPISAGITPRMENGSVDPHVWLDPNSVLVWAGNVEEVLSALDPDNAALYADNAQAYRVQLEDLDEYLASQVAIIPEANRLLVTNHDSLGYFADRYRFEVIGTVIPGTSTGAEPSASSMAQLADTMTAEGVCTIFLEAPANASLAEAVAEEVDGCDDVQIQHLYTGALGPVGSPAGTYIGMMRTNMATMVEGLAD